MTKKIFDILPPESSETSPQKGHLLVKKKPSLKKRKGKNIFLFLTPLFFLILISVILFGFRMSRADIKISPETEIISLETKLTVDAGVKSSNFGNNVIKGQAIEAEKSVSGTFSSSGKTLKKAEGIIRLYNAYATKRENWLKGTRFVSDAGKLFKSKDKISVPGVAIKDGKIDPVYVDVPVEAAEPGQDYNIDPSHFSIFVFRGTPRYTKYYGESSEAMTGGGEGPQVTEEDLQKAEDVLIEKAKIAVEESLNNKVPEGFIFLKDVLETEILEKFSLTRPGDQKERFNFNVKAQSATVIFEKKDAENFVKKLALSQIPEQKLLYEESLKVNYTPEAINLESGKIVLSLSFSIKIYPEIDLNLLEEGLMGKSLTETKIFLESQPGVMKATAKLWPFWIQSVPNDLDRIEIQYPLID